MAILMFQAARVRTEVDADCQFILLEEKEGDEGGKIFAMLNEDEAGRTVRIWWRDGKDAEDERIIGLAGVTVALDRFVVRFAPGPKQKGKCKYDGVSIDFAPEEGENASALIEALRALLVKRLNIIRLNIPGMPERLPNS